MPPERAPSRLELALLGVIHQGPQSGYDLRKAFTLTPLAHFSDSPGAIYPALGRLRRRGLVEPAVRERARGRRRVAFRLTPSGRRVFLAWLRRLPTSEEVERDVDALLLRFAFMSQAVGTAEIRRFLKALQERLLEHLENLEAFLAGAGAAMTLSGRLAFECGLEGVRADLRWVEHAQRATAPATVKGD